MLRRKISEKILPLADCHEGSAEYENSVDHLLKSFRFIQKSHDTENDKKDLYDEYLAEVEGDITVLLDKFVDRDAFCCPSCKTPCVMDSRESSRICPKCGLNESIIEVNGSNLNYSDQVDHDSKKPFVYKRISHMAETLNAAQGLQNTHVPEEVFQCIREEIKKNRIDPASLTPNQVKLFLKRRSLPRFYERAVFILREIRDDNSNITIPNLIIDSLMGKFNEVQRVFEKYAGERKNLLRYNYIVVKLLELIPRGEEFIHLFPLLKSRQKILQHDTTWRMICEDLNWEFKSTI